MAGAGHDQAGCRKGAPESGDWYLPAVSNVERAVEPVRFMFSMNDQFADAPTVRPAQSMVYLPLWVVIPHVADVGMPMSRRR